MNYYNQTQYQKNQIKVINQIEERVRRDQLTASVVSPVNDYDHDPRLCLTSVHFPHKDIINEITSKLINPLKEIDNNHYYYGPDQLHLTIKNIRTISDPPTYTDNDVRLAKTVFAQVVPQHYRFKVYFYRLLLFKVNLALIGTTDPELDNLVLHLDSELQRHNVGDDKIYSNNKYFFCNMTLARFNQAPSKHFINMVNKLSAKISLPIYTVDSVTMITTNAAMKNRKIIDNWSLGP